MKHVPLQHMLANRRHGKKRSGNSPLIYRLHSNWLRKRQGYYEYSNIAEKSTRIWKEIERELDSLLVTGYCRLAEIEEQH